MLVEWVIPCRYVEVNGNLITIVSGNIDRLSVPFLPAPVPVQILAAIRITAAHAELDEKAKLSRSTLSPRACTAQPWN